MGLTHFPHGIASFGVPLIGQELAWSPYGNVWFVDGVAGGLAASGSGTRENPFTTMDQALRSVGSGDVIIFRGNVREQLVSPVGIFDVTIIGAGKRPRHADAHTGNNGYSAATWRAPASGAVAGQANLRVLQQGWRFANILFVTQGATAAGLEIVRDAGAGNAERDGSHAQVLGCRFAGAGVGIRSGVAGSFTENCYNVEIAYNKFNDSTTAISGIVANSFSIHHNEFQGCTSIITLAAQNTMIYENILGKFTAAANSGGIDLNGGGGNCFVTKNYLSGTYSIAGGYRVSGASDEWAGNWNTLAGGITVNDPA